MQTVGVGGGGGRGGTIQFYTTFGAKTKTREDKDHNQGKNKTEMYEENGTVCGTYTRFRVRSCGFLVQHILLSKKQKKTKKKGITVTKLRLHLRTGQI